MLMALALLDEATDELLLATEDGALEELCSTLEEEDDSTEEDVLEAEDKLETDDKLDCDDDAGGSLLELDEISVATLLLELLCGGSTITELALALEEETSTTDTELLDSELLNAELLEEDGSDEEDELG